MANAPTVAPPFRGGGMGDETLETLGLWVEKCFGALIVISAGPGAISELTSDSKSAYFRSKVALDRTKNLNLRVLVKHTAYGNRHGIDKEPHIRDG